VSPVALIGSSSTPHPLRLAAAGNVMAANDALRSPRVQAAGLELAAAIRPSQ
jgi:hypothetical protein